MQELSSCREIIILSTVERFIIESRVDYVADRLKLLDIESLELLALSSLLAMGSGSRRLSEVHSLVAV